MKPMPDTLRNPKTRQHQGSGFVFLFLYLSFPEPFVHKVTEQGIADGAEGNEDQYSSNAELTAANTHMEGRPMEPPTTLG